MNQMIQVLRRLTRGLERQEGILHSLLVSLDRTELYGPPPDARMLRVWADQVSAILGRNERLQKTILDEVDVDADDDDQGVDRHAAPATMEAASTPGHAGGP